MVSPVMKACWSVTEVSSAFSCQHYSVVMVTDVFIYISLFFLHLQLTVGGKCCSWNKSVRGTDPDF